MCWASRQTIASSTTGRVMHLLRMELKVTESSNTTCLFSPAVIVRCCCRVQHSGQVCVLPITRLPLAARKYLWEGKKYSVAEFQTWALAMLVTLHGTRPQCTADMLVGFARWRAHQGLGRSLGLSIEVLVNALGCLKSEGERVSSRVHALDAVLALRYKSLRPHSFCMPSTMALRPSPPCSGVEFSADTPARKKPA